MVEDLRLDAEIEIVPTIRDTDGLALSSRNAYLSADERAAARAIPLALAAAREAHGAPGATVDAVGAAARGVLDAEPGIRVDYVEIVDADTFEPATSLDGPRLLLVAAYSGRTRLLDNTAL